MKKIEELGPKLLETYKVDPLKPTLVMTECLLVYLQPAESDKILNWVSQFFNQTPYVGIINYEMVDPHDAFG